MGPSYFPSCIAHPHHLVVGVCAFCLEERLISLIQSETPSELLSSDGSYGADDDGEYGETHNRFYEFDHKKVCHDNAENVPPLGYRPSSCVMMDAQLPAVHRNAQQKNQRSPYLGVINQKVAEMESAHVQFHAEQGRRSIMLQQQLKQKNLKKKQMQLSMNVNVSQATSKRASNASEHDFHAVKHRLCDESRDAVGTLKDAPTCKKSSKRSSWFGSSKSKPVFRPQFHLPTSPLQHQQQQGFFIDQLRSPLHYIISAGRKSSSNTTNAHGSGGEAACVNQSRLSVDHAATADYHHHHHPSSAEYAAADSYTATNALKKPDQSGGNNSSGSHSSWISSLFHRRKQKPMTGSNLKRASGMTKKQEAHAKMSAAAIELEAGRLSLDAAKLNMQMRPTNRSELEKGRQSLQADLIGMMSDPAINWSPFHGHVAGNKARALNSATAAGHGMMQYNTADDGESLMQMQRCEQGRRSTSSRHGEHDAEGMEAMAMHAQMMMKKNSIAKSKKQKSAVDDVGSTGYGRMPSPMDQRETGQQQQSMYGCETGQRQQQQLRIHMHGVETVHNKGNGINASHESCCGHGHGDDHVMYGDGGDACNSVARSKSWGGRAMIGLSRSYFSGLGHHLHGHSRQSKATATEAAAMAS